MGNDSTPSRATCPLCGGAHAAEAPCEPAAKRPGAGGTLALDGDEQDPSAGSDRGNDLLVGSAVGSFRIVRPLGRGGMGAVYLAEHPVIGSKVAVKFLHESLAADADLVARFFDEARAVNLIGHENIVGIYDLSLLPPNRYFIVMEYLEGETLAARQRVGALEPRVALDILVQLCGALHCAHERGVVHRDLKPDNIFLVRRSGRDDFVKLVDFGIAKLRDASAGPGHTRAGMIVGTPEYMAPEQCDNRPVDARADIYALGVMAYELATGRLPFAGGLIELLLAHQRERPPPPRAFAPGVDAAWEAAILRALEKRPEDRFPDMAAFAAALEEPLARARSGAAAQAAPAGAAAGAASRATPVAYPEREGDSPQVNIAAPAEGTSGAPREDRAASGAAVSAGSAAATGGAPAAGAGSDRRGGDRRGGERRGGATVAVEGAAARGATGGTAGAAAGPTATATSAAPPAPPAPPLSIELRLPGSPSPARLAATDLSRAGVFVHSAPPLPPLFSRLPLTLHHPSLARPLPLRGEVVRHVGERDAASWGIAPGFAVQFTDLAPEQRTAIAGLSRTAGPPPAAPASTGAEAPPRDAAADARRLEELERGAVASHYDLLGLAPDADFSDVRARARALRTELEELRGHARDADAGRRVAALLDRVESAAAVLGAPSERLLYDARRGNFRGVGRCATAGIPAAVLAARRRTYLADRPGSDELAQRHLARARVASAMKNDRAALAEYEAALAADPLDLSLHEAWFSLRRRMETAR